MGIMRSSQAARSILFFVFVCFLTPLGLRSQDRRPYRLLLVISEQWKDPRSFVIAGGGEFQTMVTMFKSWGIPFDIVRLDQRVLNPNDILDMERHPRYGAIVWDVDSDHAIRPQNLEVLKEAVERQHVSLIAIGNRIKLPAIQELLGIEYKAEHLHGSRVKKAAPESFLLRGLPEDLDEGGPKLPFRERIQVQIKSAEVLATQGGMPAITERELSPTTRAIWIGGDVGQMFQFPAIRTVLRRAVTEAIGYALVKTWTNNVILVMDDIGNAQNAWLEHWHYPALSADQIRTYLIEPLRKHHAVLALNVVPGFVDDERQRVEPTWKQTFVDAFGTKQDYVSTKRGIDEGLAAGVFEIHSHGWTHMQPDLKSAPGPWWGSPLDGERAEVGWYREFYDVRRNREIPAAEQKMHLEQSKQWLREQFGVDPLEFGAGGNAISTSPENNTWRIAAEVGFGFYGGYIGRDMAVQGLANGGAEFGGSDDVPLVLAAPPDGHDRGIARDPEGFAKVFDLYPGRTFMGFDDYVGYMHADIRTVRPQGGADKGTPPGNPQFTITYDPHYCRALISKGSTWQLHLADWFRSQLKPEQVSADGNLACRRPQEWCAVSFGTGMSDHTLQIQ